MGHTVNPPTSSRDGIDVQLHDIPPWIQRRQQCSGLLIRLRITELRCDDRAVDHELIDVPRCKVVITFAALVTPPAQRR